MDVVSFARGIPAPECLAVDELADCAKAAIERDGKTVLSYGPGGGYGPLREWIAERHGVEPGRVVITSGSLQAFVFLAEQLVQPGARVIFEAPTYDRPIKILRRLGAEMIGIPMDDEGLVTDALEEALASGPKPAFLYTIATFQNPSGRTLSEARRRRIVEIAREHELPVIEDDPYGLVRFEGAALPSLFELERHAPEGAVWTRPEGGYYIWLDLDHDAPSLAAAQAAGVTFVEGKDFFADGSGGQSMRLAFSYVSTDEIAEGVARLAPLLAGAAAPVA